MTRWQKALLVGFLAVAGCLGAVAWSSAGQIASRRQKLEEGAHLVARQSAARLRAGLEKHLIALEQMATFFENSESVTEEEFTSFAASTLKRMPLCLRLSAIDASLRVRWVHPREPNRDLIGYDVRSHSLGYDTILRAIKEEEEAALSPPLELIGGAPGFVLAAPIYRRRAFTGLVVCSFRSDEYFASMLRPEVLERYEESVEDSGLSIFATPAFGASGSVVQPQLEEFDLGGRTWTIRILPKPGIVAADSRSGQVAFWIVGSLLALGIGSAAGLGFFRASEIAERFRSQVKVLRDTQDRLDGAMQQLLQAEKMTALGELVAGVAHEINNPLSSIMGYSQLLMARDIPQEVKRRLETIHSEAERMAKIVRNLLTFARKQPPEKKYLGLNGIIEKTLELKAYHFRVNQIKVERELAADLPKTMLDFHQIQQVLLNLLNNAEQAMVEAGRGGTIRLTTRRVADRIEARVSDDGPGIPDDIQARIFEPFFTTKKEGKGTGLGLSLCYGIIQEHGGSIGVESRRGEGATFCIELPVSGEALAAGEERSSAGDGPVPSLRILVIDDEPKLQDLLVDLLRSRGHQVDTASDVPEALQKIAANGHDLIVTDMKMPHGTGKDIYKAVIDRSPRLARRIVFTTGDGASAETKQFLKEAGNEIVMKPFRIEEIERAIAGAIRN